MNFREWDNLRRKAWAEQWASDPRYPGPVYTDEETIDLMMDHLERQFPVEFDESDKQFLHSVGMSHV